MKLNVVTRGLELTPALGEHIERRVGITLAGYEPHITWVVVSLVQSPDGAATCSLDLGLTPRGRLRFEKTAANLLDGLDDVVTRVSLSLGPFIENLQAVHPPVPLAPASISHELH